MPLCVAAVLLYACAYLAGRIILGNHEARWRGEIVTERARTRLYDRIVLTDEPIEQNAATWYRRSFARLTLLPMDSARNVALAVARSSDHNASSAQTLAAAEFCGEVKTERMRAALSSKKCDWELPLLSNGDQLDGTQSWHLGNCIVLFGHLDGLRRDPTAAARRYFDALSFASDLAQADYSTSLVGMAIAKAALSGLANVIALGGGTWFLETTRETLSRFATRLPTIDAGIRVARLRAAANLEIDARTVGTNVPWWLSHAVPSPLIGSWRLSQQEPLLDLLQQLSETQDRTRRQTLAKRIDDMVAASTNQTIRESVPDDCVDAVKSEEYLHRVYVATQAAIELEEQRIHRGVFPATAASLTMSLDEEGLSYQSLEDGKRYRIGISTGTSFTTILESRTSVSQ